VGDRRGRVSRPADDTRTVAGDRRSPLQQDRRFPVGTGLAPHPPMQGVHHVGEINESPVGMQRAAVVVRRGRISRPARYVVRLQRADNIRSYKKFADATRPKASL